MDSIMQTRQTFFSMKLVWVFFVFFSQQFLPFQEWLMGLSPGYLAHSAWWAGFSIFYKKKCSFDLRR
jgi:hypothetical protein